MAGLGEKGATWWNDLNSLSEEVCEAFIRFSPIRATHMGLKCDHVACEWDDLSPAAFERWCAFLRDVRSRLQQLGTPADCVLHRVEYQVFCRFVERQIDAVESGEHLLSLNCLISPFQRVRHTFDAMPKDTLAHWSAIAARLCTIRRPLDSYTLLLREGVARKLVVSKRQVLAAVRQAERYASWFEELLRQFDRRRADHDTRLGGDQQQLDSLRRELASGVSEAAGGYAALGAYLHDEYLPCAREADGVGRALYSRQIEDYFGGSGLDLDDCYRWGWAELARVRAEMESLTRLRGGELAEHLAQLSSTDVFAVPRDRFVPTIVQLQRDAVEQLDGRHFDIPPAARSIDVELVTSSSGGAQGALYRRAAVDGSRRGALVFNVGSAEPVPMFTHTSTAYHEGFPGHHMQHALQIAQGARLTRLHRELFVCHAFYEGWALYAERLMSELGFFRTLHERLGFLHQQRMRAARVVVDIGIHLGLDIPAGNPDFDAPPGTRWDFDRAVACLQSVGIAPARALSEVERYCGLPGQAICYKLGEREILRARQRFAHLTTKVFHRRLLQMGTVPLDLIECLLSSTDER